MNKKIMGAMCVMCCAVPLTTFAISSGLFASLERDHFKLRRILHLWDSFGIAVLRWL